MTITSFNELMSQKDKLSLAGCPSKSTWIINLNIGDFFNDIFNNPFYVMGSMVLITVFLNRADYIDSFCTELGNGEGIRVCFEKD